MRTSFPLMVCALALAALLPLGEGTGEAAGGAARLVTGSVLPARLLHTQADGTGGALTVRLGDGTADAGPGGAISSASLPAAAPLDEEETEELLARMPPLETGPEEQVDFALRDDSLPPPRTGETIQQPFPPRERPDVPETTVPGPLEVVRYAPDGDVPLAPHMSVTFSLPMVAVTAHADLAEVQPPVQLAPTPKGGRWRWLGTRTVLFEPAGRFPMATEYEATVPAGTRSAAGGTLDAPVSWRFRTPAPKVDTSWPTGGPHRLDPILFASFDQRVDPDDVLATTTLTAGTLTAGRKTRALRRATEEEIAADDVVRRLRDRAGEGRWVAFRAAKRLPPDTEITVTVGPGTPSAEGPLKTTEAQTFTFRTNGPFAVEENRCGWGDTCRPFAPWTIRFTNPVDETKFDASLVRVTANGDGPDLEEPAIEVSGRTLTIRGATRGRTTYTVRVDGKLRDEFGQKLGDPAKLTFAVGEARPALDMPGAPFVTLDPAGERALSVFSMNHPRLLVEMYTVDVADWPKFVRYMQRSPDDEGAPAPPGRRVVAETIEVGGAPDTLVETRLDLGRALEDGYGHVVVVVSPPKGLLGRFLGDRKRPRDIDRAWVQATRIGLTATVDASEMLTWATALETGKPVDGVRMAIVPGDAAATTGRDGLARLPLWDRDPDPDVPALLVARKGLDVAILPQRLSFWGGGRGWHQFDPGVSLRWFVFDDRKMYRPGEEVHVKGWLRRLVARERGDLEALGAAVDEVSWSLQDSRGNEVRTGVATLTALGGFDLAVTLPETMNLGSAQLRLVATPATDVTGERHTHTIQVQEFRRPEFEVKAQAGAGPHVAGGHATATVEAAYYAGGPLPGADVTWRVTTRPGVFVPAGRGEYTFGTWIPWWRPRPMAGRGHVTTHSGRTDAVGKHHLRIDFGTALPPRPTHVEASATVMDVNRQAWTASTGFLVHPAENYVGVRTDRSFVERGEPFEVQAIVTDLDGALVPKRPIVVEAVRREWVREKGRWIERDADPERRELTSANEPVTCRFTLKKGGRYRIRALTADEQDRPNGSELSLWVSGGKRPPERRLTREDVELVPDKERYEAGDVAEVLVQAPFQPAEGLLTVERSGVVSVERFTMDGPTHVLRVPIEEDYVPNVHVAVELVGSAPRVGPDGKRMKGVPDRPAFAGGSLRLPVPPLRRTLSLEARPRAARLEPGGETAVDVVLRDFRGRPVGGAEVAVVVVDEAVLALTGYRLADPLDLFYPTRPAGAHDFHLRTHVLLADLADPTAAIENAVETEESKLRFKSLPVPKPQAAMARDRSAEPAPGGAADDDAARPLALREDFRALAVFAPVVTTDANGRASVPVELPDNLTRYRVMAVAVAGARQFGSAESNITARLPLMVRPSAPRFLNFGDRFELPVVVQNQTDSPLPISVAVRASNATLVGPGGRRITVPPNDRVEVRFPVTTLRAGTARFQVGAVAGDLADAATFALPVWTPATSEAFATYGTLDETDTLVQPLRTPSDVIEEFGGLEVTTSATALQSLTDAVLYLVGYPFDCSEQIASRILTITALRDVLEAFEAEGLPSTDELVAAVGKDIERLKTLQNADGGFAFWRRGDHSWPWLSIHAAHAIARARKKGFEIPDDMVQSAQGYLRAIRKHIPDWYGRDAAWTVRAYALYVRRLLDDVDTKTARAMVREAGTDALPLEAAGFLLPTLASDPAAQTDMEDVLEQVDNRVTETAGGAHFVTSYEDGAHVLLHSDRRVDGILLEALVEVRPVNELVPKLVAGLLAHRKRGRWANTQENAFVLLALDRYFAEYERQPPSFVARVWLGERYAGEHAFEGRTTETYELGIPMRHIVNADGPQDLVVAKEGAGRMYYRIGMRYAPADLTLAPLDQGFTVERTYEAVDDPADVRRGEDGVWHVRAGARVRVRLGLVAPTRRYHVALVDPLPAGLEALNPALAVTGPLPEDPQAATRGGAWWWWTRTWYEHQNLRDERVEAFASLLWPGVHEYTYVARATTPGRFVVPPPRAEEMYAPETFGRGATEWVVVE